MKNLRWLQAMAMALLVAGLGAGGAQAAILWPNGNPYACTWSLPHASGTALVTFQLGGSNFDVERQGQLTNLYPTGAKTTVGLNMILQYISYEDRFSLSTSNGIACTLFALDNGRRLQFRFCSNGAIQDCYQ